MEFPIFYILDESILIFKGIRSTLYLYFLFLFSNKFIRESRKDSDRMPLFAASHLGLFCLSLTYKRATWLISLIRKNMGLIHKKLLTMLSTVTILHKMAVN